MKEFKFVIDGHKFSTTVNELEGNLAEVTVNGTTFKVEIEKEQPAATAPRPTAQKVVSAAQQAAAPAAGGVQVVKSPLPGSIVKVNIKVGDNVKVGDELLTMESMKMENSVKSEFCRCCESRLRRARQECNARGQTGGDCHRFRSCSCARST